MEKSSIYVGHFSLDAWEKEFDMGEQTDENESYIVQAVETKMNHVCFLSKDDFEEDNIISSRDNPIIFSSVSEAVEGIEKFLKEFEASSSNFEFNICFLQLNNYYK